MDRIIQQSKKRKKTLQKGDTEKYERMLEQMFENYGLSGEAFPYISDASKICGLDVLTRWLGKQKDPCECLKKFLVSEDFGNSKIEAATHIIFSALKSVLGDTSLPPKCAGVILEAASSRCKTKDGKWLSSIHKIFHDRFSKLLARDVVLPPIAELGLNNTTISGIREMAGKIYERMRENDGIKPDGTKQRRVLEWLGVKYPAENGNAVIPPAKQDAGATKEKQDESGPGISPNVDTRPCAQPVHPSVGAKAQTSAERACHGAAETPETKFRCHGDKISSLLRELTDEGLLFAKKMRKLEEENSRLKGDVARGVRNLEAFRAKNDDLERRLAEKDREIERLGGEIKNLGEEQERNRAESDRKLCLKDEDIKRFQQEIMERDHKMMALRKRLANDLRTDYNEFAEVKDAEMDVSMGNVMRERLGGVFRILADNGIDFGESS